MALFFAASEKKPCEEGTYSRPYSIVCKNCERGYTCEKASNTSRPPDKLCNKGGYCDGKTFIKCPEGTYNPVNGSRYETDCVTCPAGELEGLSFHSVFLLSTKCSRVFSACTFYDRRGYRGEIGGNLWG